MSSSRPSDASRELEHAMVWRLLRFSVIPVGVALLIWYVLLFFEARNVIGHVLPSFIAVLLLLPLTIQFSAKLTLAQIEAGGRAGVCYYFWAFLWQYFFFLNIVIIIGVYALRHRLAQLLNPIVGSQFFANHHFVIFLLAAVLLVGYTIRFAIRTERLDWEILDRIKAVSIVSPAYCFGGAALWSKVLSPLGVSSQDTRVLVTASIVAGLCFLLFLFLYVLLHPKDTETREKQGSRLLDHGGEPLQESKDNSISFALYGTAFTVGLGIAVFLGVVLDAVHLVLR